MTKEGLLFPLPFLVISVALFLIFRRTMTLSWLYFSAGFFYVGLLISLFFRDPERRIPKGDDLILSPADGRIIRLENKGNEAALSIFLAIHNVHVNRSPVKGVIKSVVYHPGKYHSAFRNDAMSENQRNEIEIETDKGIVRMHQVSGAIARRTIFYRKPGEYVQAGERVGLIRFGSRIDLVLPPGTAIEARLKQKVVAGESILGRLP